MLTVPQIKAAVAALDATIVAAMKRTGVPGIAVTVVYDDMVLYAKGFGVRRVGRPEAVSPETIFQLAGLSKPIASTVVAGLVGDKTVAWTSPVVSLDRSFALSDAWVGNHATLADMFANRSGLPDGAGDLLEDLGYDQAYVLSHLKFQPLGPFRASYANANFGLTAAAVATAKAAGTTWPALSRSRLYQPLGMTSTSSRFADFRVSLNTAATHVRTASGWQPKFVRKPDVQSPANGVSSSARDLASWLRLQLGAGVFNRERIIDATALTQTRVPHALTEAPPTPAGEPGFYGLGWNIAYDQVGRLRLSRSGAFALGAANAVAMLPSEQLGIVVLTNAQPIGVAESIAFGFLDTAAHGHLTVDWSTYFGKGLATIAAAGRSPTDYAKPPAGAAEARANSAYTGTYTNAYYGNLSVTAAAGGALSMSLGPRPMTFPLTHYSGDTFSYVTTGETAVGRSGVTFMVSGDRATAVQVENLNRTGLGTFTLVGP